MSTNKDTIERHYGMDWLRISAFALLILYHIGMFFVPWGWHIKTDQIQEWVQYPMLASNPWRIPLLFLVSGYASRAMLSKPTVTLSAFFKDRSVRLVVPLLAGIALFCAPQVWIELQFKGDYSKGFWEFWLSDYFSFRAIQGIIMPTYNHLWFVLYLFAYTVVAIALLALTPSNLKHLARYIMDRLLGSSIGWIIWPIAFLLASLTLIPDEGLGPQVFVGDWYRHIVFFGMFGIGFCLAGSALLWSAVRKSWKVAISLGVFAYAAAMVVLVGWQKGSVSPDLAEPLFQALQAVQAWGVIAGLIGLSDQFLNRDAPMRSYLSLGVFPFYIIHQTIIVLVGYWTLWAGLGVVAQLLAILLATVLGCWLFYEAARRSGPLKPTAGLR